MSKVRVLREAQMNLAGRGEPDHGQEEELEDEERSTHEEWWGDGCDGWEAIRHAATTRTAGLRDACSLFAAACKTDGEGAKFHT